MALMGEEQIAAQSVQALALVQLPADSAAESFVSDVSRSGYMPASPNSLTHGRDLAQGTGQPAERPEAPAEQELAFARTQLSTIPRTGRFSPAQTDADDAPTIDRPSPSSALCQLGSTS